MVSNKRLAIVAPAMAVGVFTVLFGGSVHAQTAEPPFGPYVRGDIGGAFVTNQGFVEGGATKGAFNSSVGFLGGGGVGWRFSPIFRTDLTVDYLSTNRSGTTAGGPVSTGTASAVTGLANGYVDLNGIWPNLFGPVDPYIDAGVGMSGNHLTGVTSPAGSVPGGWHNSFAWAAGAGVGVPIVPRLTLDVAYRYVDLGALHSSSAPALGPVKTGFTEHTLTGGLRYAF